MASSLPISLRIIRAQCVKSTAKFAGPRHNFFLGGGGGCAPAAAAWKRATGFKAAENYASE